MIIIILVIVATIIYFKKEKFKFALHERCTTVSFGIVVIVVALAAGFCGKQKPSFHFALIIAAGFLCFTLFAIPWLKFDYKEYVGNVNCKDVIQIILKPQGILFLCVALHVGKPYSFSTRWLFVLSVLAESWSRDDC